VGLTDFAEGQGFSAVGLRGGGGIFLDMGAAIQGEGDFARLNSFNKTGVVNLL